MVVGDATQAIRTLSSSDPYAGELIGNVRLCYLDPPFNTGETFTHYGDARHPAAWRRQITETLEAVRFLLSPHASIWFHIDDAGQHVARNILDQVFGAGAFVSTIVWQKRLSRDNRTAFSSMHDYIHVYAPIGAVKWAKLRNGLPDRGKFANPDLDARGPWRSVPLSVQAGHGTASQFYAVESPTGARHEPPPGRCWAYSAAKFKALEEDGRIYWPRSGAGRPRLKRFEFEVSGLAPSSLWMADEVGSNPSAKKALMAEVQGVPPFDTPKPLGLMERIISIGTAPGEIVLDPFLGSGTTAVAATNLGRRWVGIEREANTVATFVVPRLRMATSENFETLVLPPLAEASQSSA